MVNFRLKALRVGSNKTQAEIAKVLNVSKPTYLKKENGIRKFSLVEVVKLKNYFNLSLQEVWDVFFNQKVNNTETREEK